MKQNKKKMIYKNILRFSKQKKKKKNDSKSITTKNRKFLEKNEVLVENHNIYYNI